MNLHFYKNTTIYAESLIILLLLFLTGFTHARDIKGEIFYADRIENVIFKTPVSFGNPEFGKLQNGVVYFDEAGQKKVLRPYQAEKIRFRLKNVTHVMMSRNYMSGGNLQFKDQFFMYLAQDGFSRLFVFFEYRISLFTPVISYYLIQKDEDSLTRFSMINFKDAASQYFGSCPKLVKKIETGEFRFRDIPEIVHYFNMNCSRSDNESLD